MQARWAVSADPELREQGTVTGIEYSDLFDTYLEYLKHGLELEKPSVLKIFRVWDGIFFHATTDTGLGAKDKSSDEASRKGMAMLEEEETEEEEPAGGNSADEEGAVSRNNADEEI